jgi:hypothetical protein
MCPPKAVCAVRIVWRGTVNLNAGRLGALYAGDEMGGKYIHGLVRVFSRDVIAGKLIVPVRFAACFGD